MRTKGMIVLVFGCFISCLVSCSSDSEMLSDKEILSGLLTDGNWQVSLQHSVTKKTLEHPEMQLNFSELGNVNAMGGENTADMWSPGNGAYSLFYIAHKASVPNYDDPEYDYLDREKDRSEELFLSLAFGVNRLVILNQRWQVKTFTSASVVLQANDMILTLNSTESK